jgi:hypothetical protein
MAQQVLLDVVAGVVGALEFIDWHTQNLYYWGLVSTRVHFGTADQQSRHNGNLFGQGLVSREIRHSPAGGTAAGLMLQQEMTIQFVEGGDLASTERDERQVHAGVGYNAP